MDPEKIGAEVDESKIEAESSQKITFELERLRFTLSSTVKLIWGLLGIGLAIGAITALIRVLMGAE